MIQMKVIQNMTLMVLITIRSTIRSTILSTIPKKNQLYGIATAVGHKLKYTKNVLKILIV